MMPRHSEIGSRCDAFYYPRRMETQAAPLRNLARQAMYSTYIVTWRWVHETIVVVEKQ